MANAHRRRNSMARIRINGVCLIEDREIKEGVVMTFCNLLFETYDQRPSINGLAFESLDGLKIGKLEELFSEEEVFNV